MVRPAPVFVLLLSLAACGPADPSAGDAGAGPDAGFAVEMWRASAAVESDRANEDIASELRSGIISGTIATPQTDAGGDLVVSAGPCTFTVPRVAPGVIASVRPSGGCAFTPPLFGVPSMRVLSGTIWTPRVPAEENPVRYTLDASLAFERDGLTTGVRLILRFTR